MSARRRPKKLDRESTRTAVASCRFGSKADRDKVYRGGGPKGERGPCTVFDRGRTMTAAIQKAARYTRSA